MQQALDVFVCINCVGEFVFFAELLKCVCFGTTGRWGVGGRKKNLCVGVSQ